MRAALDGRVIEAPEPGHAAQHKSQAGAAQHSSVVSGAMPRTAFAEAGPTGLDLPERGSRLGHALAAGRFVVSVEIDPPRSVRIERTIEAARLLQSAGVDLVNVSDSAMARVRMGALAVAFGIQHDLDLECLVHTTTRDRNLMALESELLGAHALGVRNILALTGDPPRIGDYPTGTGVWDVDSIGLIEILARLNRGEDQAGSPIGHRPRSPSRAPSTRPPHDTATEWDRLERKLAAGAHLIMTQPLYDVAQVEAMLAEARRALRAARLPGPGAARRPAARTRPATRSSCTTRSRASRSPTRPAPAWRRRRGAAPRPASRWPTRCSPACRGRGRGHVPDAQLRPLRAGRRARPPDPRAPPGRHGGRLLTPTRSRIVRPCAATARPSSLPSRRGVRLPFSIVAVLALALAAGPVAAGPPFPDPVNGQAVYDTAGVFRDAR